jgi:hypothetical protein
VPGKIAARIAPGGAPEIDLRCVGLLPAADRLFALEEPPVHRASEEQSVKHATAATIVAATIRCQRDGDPRAPTALGLACPLQSARRGPLTPPTGTATGSPLWADVFSEDDETFAARLERVHRPLHEAAPWSTPAMQRPMSSGEASAVASA